MARVNPHQNMSDVSIAIGLHLGSILTFKQLRVIYDYATEYSLQLFGLWQPEALRLPVSQSGRLKNFFF